MINKNFYKTFHIHCGTYDFGINFIISDNLNKVEKFVNHKLELTGSEKIDKSNFDCLGKRIFINGYCPIIWLSSIPTEPKQYGTLYHEIFHVICDVMRWANIPLDYSSEEAYCHLIGHITTQFFKKIQSL